MSKHLILISLDALCSSDYSIFRHLPIFKDFIENGAYFPKVTPTYPSLTYPCHTTIITGVTPDIHGIYNNEIPNPSKSPHQDWFWYEKAIQATTLFDVAYANGLTSAAVCYPVMAGSETITYNFPEIFSNSGESQLSLFWKYGSRSLFMNALKHSSKAKGLEQPYLDNFSTSLFKDILRKKKPNLAALHLTELDSARHHYGTHSPEAKQAIISMANRVAEIIWLTKEIGIYEETTFALFGDHGFQDYHTAISFNCLLKELDLLETDEQNKITDWKVYGASADGSLQIYLKDPSDLKLQNQVEVLIQTLLDLPEKPIKASYTAKQVKQDFNLSGGFSYVLEANVGFSFVPEILNHYLTPVTMIPNSYVATHGYLPNLDKLKTTLLIKGPEIKRGIHVDEISLLHHAATFAKCLGLPWSTRSSLPIFK